MTPDAERNGPDYRTHYFDLVREIAQALGPFFGALRGPHPQICGTCKGGPCPQEVACAAEYLWIHTPEDLLDLAAKQLTRMPAYPANR